MEVTANTAADSEETWRGGNKPLNVSYGKMMMWFFIVSDALTFTGFLVSYGFSRFKNINSWPIADEVFTHFPFLHGIDAPMYYVALMTFILILSSVTMVLAVEAGHRMDRQGVEKWMVWTIIGGFTFLGCQAWEWSHFIHGTDVGSRLLDGSIIYGANLELNQYGPPDFAAFFFFITGFHGFHVFSGVALNFLIFYQATVGILERRGHYEMVEKVGLYWHFVDLVWVFVFTFFYLV